MRNKLLSLVESNRRLLAIFLLIRVLCVTG